MYRLRRVGKIPHACFIMYPVLAGSSSTSANLLWDSLLKQLHPRFSHRIVGSICRARGCGGHIFPLVRVLNQAVLTMVKARFFERNMIQYTLNGALQMSEK